MLLLMQPAWIAISNVIVQTNIRNGDASHMEDQTTLQAIAGREIAEDMSARVATTSHEGMCPICVPPRRILAYHCREVERQINEMLEQGIITPSSNPWMAPVVFVPKKSGGLRICIDYRELKKTDNQRCIPFFLQDEVQDCLPGFTIFLYTGPPKQILAITSKVGKTRENSLLSFWFNWCS